MEDSISSKEVIASINFYALLLMAIVVFLTRSTPVERLFRFILVSRHGTAMNQRCSESNGLPKDEDTKLKKKRKLLVRNVKDILLVVTVFRIP